MSRVEPANCSSQYRSMKPRAGFKPAVEIERGDHRLAGAGQDRRLLAPAAAGFRIGEDQMRRKPRLLPPPRAQASRRASALSFSASAPSGSSGIEMMQLLRDHQPQHAVAQKFQPLVGCDAELALACVSARVSSALSLKAWPRRASKCGSRHQSMTVKSRVIADRPRPFPEFPECALPLVEKKMNSALPTRFCGRNVAHVRRGCRRNCRDCRPS